MRKATVQHSLCSINKCIKAHADVAEDFNAATDSMHTMLGEFVKALSSGGEGDPSIQGYVGHLNKLMKAHQGSTGAGKSAQTAFHDAVTKAVSGAALKVGVDLLAANANDRSDEGATIHHGVDTTSPGVVEYGLKGATAADLQKLANALPLANLAVEKSLFRSRIGLVNKNSNANPHDFTEERGGANLRPVEKGCQTRVLSTYELRQTKK